MNSKILEILKQKSNLVIVIVIVILGFSLYANTFDNELFWDDDQFILENQYIKDWQYFPKYFSENVIAGAGRQSDYWRPALLTVFSLEWHMFGPSRLGFHLTNTLFHIANAILLFFILKKLFQRKYLALFVSFVFLAHPLQTEAVSYANSLGDSLSVFFMFLGLLFYLRFKATGQSISNSYSFFGSVLCFPLALMSKETAIILPGLLILVEVINIRNAGFISRLDPIESDRAASQNRDPETSSGLRTKFTTILKNLWPFIVIALAYIILRSTSLNFVNTFNLYNEQNTFTDSIFVRIFTFFRILTVYLSLIFWPQNLHMERNVDLASSLFHPDIVLGAVICVLMLTIGLIVGKKYPILSFGIFWFFICLSLTSNILIPINGLLYEHWLYLPIIGIALAVSSGVLELIKRYPKFSKVVPVLAILTLIPLSASTIARNNDWDNSINFYTQTLAYSPESYRVTNNLGMELAERSLHEQAMLIYYKAIALDDTNPVAYHNLANSYRDTKKFDLAIKYYNKALELDPQFTFSYGALANFYIDQKNYDKALETLDRYAVAFPDKVEIYIVAAKIATMLKDYSRAEEYKLKAQELQSP